MRKLSGIHIAYAVALVSVIAVYGHTVFYGFVNWDDHLLLIDNALIRGFSLTNLKAAFTSYDPELYIPLTFLSYQLDFALAGLSPFVIHLHNLLLHMLNASLVAGFIYLLTKKQWVSVGVLFLFLLHPLHAEAVVWASSRKDLLSTAFYLGSMIAYLSWLDSRKGTLYALSVGLAFLGFLAKVTVVSIPFSLLLLAWIRKRSFDRSLVLEILPFLSLSILFGCIALFGKSIALSDTNMFELILMAGKSTATYIVHIIAPLHLRSIYLQDSPVTLVDPVFFLSWILLIGMMAIAWVQRNKHPLVSFGLAFFLITLVPTFQNYLKGGHMFFASDRYAYLPSVGIFLLIVLIYDHYRTWYDRWFVAVITGAFVICMSVTTFAQSSTWQSTESLFENVLEHDKDNTIALHRLFVHYDELGKVHSLSENWIESYLAYTSAARYEPSSALYTKIAVAAHGIGLPYEEMEWYRRALDLDPTYKPARYNLGIALLDQGEVDEAREQWSILFDQDSDYFNIQELLDEAE